MDLESTLEKMISMQGSELTLMNCDVCGESQRMDVEILGKTRTVRCLCKCEREAQEERKQFDEDQKKMKRLDKLRKYSLMDDRFESCTFDSWSDDIGHPKLKKIVDGYVSNWSEMFDNNIGLLIYGDPGIGKTHAAFTIANEIINRYKSPVIAISSIGMLSRIKETYNKYGQEAEIDIIKTLENAKLLIIDDLGAEQKTVWSTSMLYQIIDSRYRGGKPMFITTNLTLDKLKEKLTVDDGVNRIYDRIVESCQLIGVKGGSNRPKVAKEKRQKLIAILEDDKGDG